MTDREAIERAIESFTGAYNAGDLAGVLACYGDDLVKLRHGAPPESKPALAGRLEQVFRTFATRLEVRNDEIMVVGEMAFARGQLEVTLTPRGGGPPQSTRRRFLEIWRRAGGRWLVIRTMDAEI